MKRSLIILLSLILVTGAITSSSTADGDEIVSIVIDDRIGVYHIPTNDIYIPKNYAYYAELKACDQVYKHKEEGLWFDRYVIGKIDKKNPPELSKCQVYEDVYVKPEDTFKIASEDELKRMSKQERRVYDLNKKINDLAQTIFSERKYKPIKDSEYGRISKTSAGNIRGVYVGKDKYQRMIFASIKDDVGKLEARKISDNEIIKYLQDKEAYEEAVRKKEEEDAKKENEENQAENIEQPESDSSKPESSGM